MNSSLSPRVPPPSDLAAELTNCYDKRQLPSWATIIEAAYEIEHLRNVLERARTILANMAKENPPRIAFGWQRWPFSHELLRADARYLLPDIDKVFRDPR